MDTKWRADRIAPRSRVISDNDYCGDPDGVIQIAHHLLCPSVDVRMAISSAVAPHHPSWNEHCADDGVAVVRGVTELVGRSELAILPGSSQPMSSTTEPARSPAVEALIAEAMRDDTDLPLFVTCAGGLTTIASAWLLEPRIAERLTIVWLGGHAYDVPEADLPADARFRETNVMTDVSASQVVFDSNLPLWQIPQDAFSDLMASRAELAVRMRPHGALGRHLFDSVGTRVDAWSVVLKMGETYSFGDSSVVLLTALGGAYSGQPSSSRWITRPRPRLTSGGAYQDNPEGAPIRVFTKLDVRLLFEDLYAKLELHSAEPASAE